MFIAFYTIRNEQVMLYKIIMRINLSSLFQIYFLLNAGIIIAFAFLLPNQAIGICSNNPHSEKAHSFFLEQTLQGKDVSDFAVRIAALLKLTNGDTSLRITVTPESFLLAHMAKVERVKENGEIEVLFDQVGQANSHNPNPNNNYTGGTFSRVSRNTHKDFFKSFFKKILEGYQNLITRSDSVQEISNVTTVRSSDGEKLFEIETMQDGGVTFRLHEGGYNSFNSINWGNVEWGPATRGILISAVEAKNKEAKYRQENGNPSFVNRYISPEHILLALTTMINNQSISRLGLQNIFAGIPKDATGIQWLKEYFSNDLSTRQQQEVENAFYKGIEISRSEDQKDGITTSEYPSNVSRPPFFSNRERQNTTSEINIPFTSRPTETQSVNLYPLDPSLYKKLATDLINPINSHSIVITGDIGSGRHSLGSLVMREVQQTQAHRIESIELQHRQRENRKDEQETPNAEEQTTSNTVNIYVFHFDPSKIMTEGETRYVGVISKNTEQFIESIENALSNNRDAMIILHISHTPLNTLLNFGKTEGDSGTQMRDGLIRLIEQYPGQLKILGYTEPATHRAFKDSSLGTLFREVIKSPPNMEGIGKVLEFMVERRIEMNNDNNISNIEKAMIIKGILYLYQTYNTHRLTYFKDLQTTTDIVFQEVQTLKENKRQNGQSDITISENELYAIISRSFLNNQPIIIERRDKEGTVGYNGSSIYRDTRGALEHVRKTVVQDNSLIMDILERILLSSNKPSGGDDNARPYSITILGGPPGTGKTILIEAIARWLFPHLDKPYFHIDANNQTNSTKILGEPTIPGRSEDSRVDKESLTGYVSAYPNAIIYVNEFHRLKPNIIELLESILEYGKITDEKGRVVSFEQTHWIFDFNPVNKLDPSKMQANSKETTIKWLEENTPQSFQDRVQVEKAFYIPELTKAQLTEIASLMIANRNWTVEANEVYEIIAANNEGARGIRGYVQMLNVERQRQLNAYTDEDGFFPSGLRTRLIVENNDIRVVVESQADRYERQENERQMDNTGEQQPISPENEPSSPGSILNLNR